MLLINVIHDGQDDRHDIIYMVQKEWNAKMIKPLHGYAVFTA